MLERSALRPIERRVLQMRDEGVAEREIARRFGRSPAFIGRVIQFTSLDGRTSPAATETLRPLERRVLAWRHGGAGYEDIAPRFARSADFIRRVESMAHYKLSGL